MMDLTHDHSTPQLKVMIIISMQFVQHLKEIHMHQSYYAIICLRFE